MKKFFEISKIIGLTCTSVKVADNDKSVSFVGEGWKAELYHAQDCCEYVYVEEVIGDLNDLVGVPVLSADESSNEEGGRACGDHTTWTFYRLATSKGYVTIRFCGTSNGYYSEGVDFLIEFEDGESSQSTECGG